MGRWKVSNFTFSRSANGNCLVYVYNQDGFDPTLPQPISMRQILFSQGVLPVRDDFGQVQNVQGHYGDKQLTSGTYYGLLILLAGQIGDKVSIGISPGPVLNDYQFRTFINGKITEGNSSATAAGYRIATIVKRFQAV